MQLSRNRAWDVVVALIALAIFAFVAVRVDGLHSSSTLALFAALTIVALLSWHLWRRDRTRESTSNLGAALLGGLVVGFTVLIAQLLIQGRSDDAAELRNLRLIVGLQRDLTGIDLNGRDLRGFFLREKTLRLAQLNDTDLSEADLYGADLSHSNLGNADLRRASLAYANVFSANLGDADLRGASLVNAKLEQSNFEGANLGGTDLRGADLRGSFYDDETRWPSGFDPATRGLIDQCDRLRRLGIAPDEAGVTCR